MPQGVRCAYVYFDSQIGMDAALLDALLAHEIEREFTRLAPKLRQEPTRLNPAVERILPGKVEPGRIRRSRCILGRAG